MELLSSCLHILSVYSNAKLLFNYQVFQLVDAAQAAGTSLGWGQRGEEEQRGRNLDELTVLCLKSYEENPDPGEMYSFSHTHVAYNTYYLTPWTNS